jgi:hypothetical protein
VRLNYRPPHACPAITGHRSKGFNANVDIFLFLGLSSLEFPA